MEKKITDQTLQQRIRSGRIRREDVARRLAEQEGADVESFLKALSGGGEAG